MQSFENKRTLQLWAGVLIGLLAVGTLFYFNLEQVRFVYDKEGTHCWTDQNQNGVADLQNSQEFYPCIKGEYRKEELADALLSINWSKNSLFFLVSALIFMGLRDLFYIIRIRFLSDRQLTWRSSFHTIMLWEFASVLSPGVMSGAALAIFFYTVKKFLWGKAQRW